MSWIGNLSMTYDVCSDVASITVDNQDKMLTPIGHTLKKADIIVYLKETGSLIKLEKAGFNICIPCTENSEGRTSRGAINKPHPLSDQIKYLYTKVYAENMANWLNYLESKPEHLIAKKCILAVYTYIQAASIYRDAEAHKVKIKDNYLIGFCVNINGALDNRLWIIPELHKAWSDYYINEYLAKNSKCKDVCYISGTANLIYTENHPKNINRVIANAKLISANAVKNDKQDFVYRGRFTNSTQAVTVSYEASQKAHQALRWLINNQSYRCDSQAIIAWAIDKIPNVPSFYNDSYSIYNSFPKSETDIIIIAENATDINYSNALRQVLIGYGSIDKIKIHKRRIAIISTDATTKNTGRMSVTYYREFQENDFNERIVDWHTSCSWYQPFDKKTVHKQAYFIGAPSFDRITTAVLGKRKLGEDDSYDKVKKRIRERILHCMFDGECIPIDFVNSAVNHASNPLSLEVARAKTAFDRWRDWEQVLCSACSLVKKYYHDYLKEEVTVSLDEGRTDRDYLYGRLLAIADRIETSARYKQGNIKSDARATNAIRYMTVFSQHPYRTWNTLLSQQLNPYIQQLNGAGWYMNLIQEITRKYQKIDNENKYEFEIDSPLNGSYLLGFFAQRYELMKNNKVKNDNLNGGEDNDNK